MAIILGVDPGSRITGYGLVRAQGRQLEYLDSGCIRMGEKPLAERLQIIFHSLATLIGEYRPDEFAIEQVFMARNPDSALKLGQARGAAIVSAANSGLPVFEYSARQVKQAVVGRGSAEKSQVQHMVQAILSLSRKPQADAADALAIALCHAHMSQSLVRVGTGSVAVEAAARGKVRGGRLR